MTMNPIEKRSYLLWIFFEVCIEYECTAINALSRKICTPCLDAVESGVGACYRKSVVLIVNGMGTDHRGANRPNRRF